MKMKKIVSIVLTSVILIAVLAACGKTSKPESSAAGESASQGSDQSKGSKDAIKIGVPVPLSAPGDYKSGEVNVNTLKLAQEQVNSAGGVLGRQVELVIADDQGNVSKGVSLIKNMIEKDKVSAVMGVWAGSVAQAQAKIADQSKVPFLIHYSWPDDITAMHSEYVFRVGPYNSEIVQLLVPFIKDKGYKHVAVMGEDSAYGKGFIDAMKATGEKNQFKVTGVVFSSEAVDFSPELLKLKNMDTPPDLTIVASALKPMYLIPKQAKEVGLTEKSQIMAGWDYPVSSNEYWDTVGDAGVGIIYPSFYTDKLALTDNGKKFKEDYKTKYNEYPPIYAFYLYDAFMMTMDTIKQTNSSDPQKLAEALKDIQFNGTMGTIKFDRDTSTPNSPVWNQWQGHQIFILKLNNKGDMGDKAELIWSK